MEEESICPECGSKCSQDELNTFGGICEDCRNEGLELDTE